MHGYHPTDPHSYAALLTNHQAEIPDNIQAIPDMFRLMTRDAELAKARNAAARGSGRIRSGLRNTVAGIHCPQAGCAWADSTGSATRLAARRDRRRIRYNAAKAPSSMWKR